MTLIISHGNSLYADKKIINGVGAALMLSASESTKIHKLPQAYYAVCGDQAITAEDEKKIEDIAPIHFSFIVAVDWIYNNLEKATQLNRLQINKYLNPPMIKYLITVMAMDMAEFIKTFNQTVVIKTRYSTVVINEKYCDTLPNEIPYAYGSSGSMATEMLSLGFPVDEIYRWSHQTNRVTSKEFESVNPSLEKELWPDIYNHVFYEYVLKALHRVFSDDFDIDVFKGRGVCDKLKDDYVLEVLNLASLVLSAGKRKVDKANNFKVTNIPHGPRELGKRNLDKITSKKLNYENEIDAKYSFVYQKQLAEKSAIEEANKESA